jgi:hypothetical protein
VIIEISEAKDSPKRQKTLRTQINGKFNDKVVMMKIKKIAVEALFKNYKKAIYLFIDRSLRSYTCFERNNAGLKEPSSFV